MTQTITVLFLVGQDAPRDAYQKSMSSYHMKVEFVHTLDQVDQYLKHKSVEIFVMDLSSINFEQGAAMQLRMSRVQSYSSMWRVVLVTQVSVKTLALHHDALINRVMSKGTPPMGVAGQIASMVSAGSNTSDLQRKIYQIPYRGEDYDQKEIDEMVVEAFKQFPHDDKVKLEYGNYCVRNSNIDMAQQIARELLKKDGANVRAMNLIARCLLKAGEFDQAVQFLKKADNLSPENPGRLCQLGEAYHNNGELAIAKGYYRRAIAIAPELKKAHTKLGEINIQEGNIQEAFDILAGGLSEEEAASFFNNAGVLAMRQNNRIEAMRLYNTAIKSLKTTKFKPRIMYNLALAHKKNGELDIAVKTFQQILKIDDEYEKARKQLSALLGGKDKKQAS